jgi:hypothetical protein
VTERQQAADRLAEGAAGQRRCTARPHNHRSRSGLYLAKLFGSNERKPRCG